MIMEKKIEIKLEEQIRDAIENGIEEASEFLAGLGWEDWMNEYISSDENGVLNETESREFDEMVGEMWQRAKAEMPLKLYKVYANCCRVPKHIQEVDEGALKNAMDEIFDQALEEGLLDDVIDEETGELDYEKESDAYKEIEEAFEEDGFLIAGDYEIVKAYGPGCITIPNVCGYGNYIFG